MRHYFAPSAPGPVPRLAGRVAKPARAPLLIPAASLVERVAPCVTRAGPRAVPLPAVAGRAQEELLSTVESAADDPP